MYLRHGISILRKYILNDQRLDTTEISNTLSVYLVLNQHTHNYESAVINA